MKPVPIRYVVSSLPMQAGSVPSGGVPVAPTADFIGAPTSGSVPVAVTFANQSTGIYSSVLWNFGDGATSTSENPTHNYTAAGTYTVTLTLTWAGGTVTRTRTAYIVASVPVTPALTFALADTGTAGVAASGSITNTSAVASGPWSIAAIANSTMTPSSGSSIAPGATVSLSFTATQAATYTPTLVCAGATITGASQPIVVSAAPAIALSATGGGSPTVGVPFNLSALLSNPASLPLVGTPDNVAGSASFSPTTVTWNTGDLNKTFAATWAAAGAASVRVTAPGGLVSNTLSLTVGAAAATSLTLSISQATGTSGVTVIAVTVTPNGPVPSTGTATLAVTGDSGYTIGTLTLNFTAGSSAAQSTTFTRASNGTNSIALTANSMGLSMTGTPRTYTSSAPAAPADFVARRTGGGVIAWQGFDTTSEVTAFAKPRDFDFHAVPLYREDDPVVGSCLVFKFLGARLAADFLASGGNGPRPMVLDDASDWPTTFPFRFFVTRVPLGDATTRKKTLFECTARTGNTLTVTYVPLGISEFNSGASFNDRFIGDAAGSECQNYSRLFSAMIALDNGKATDDPGASGTLPIRSRTPGNPATPPRGPSMFGYGYCAHPDYNSDARFNPWVPGYQGVGPGDGVPRSNIIDTNEIYIQFLAWFHPDMRLADMTGGKIVGIQTETTVPQQIVMGMGPGGGAFTIPSTLETPFALAKFNYTTYGSAGQSMLLDPYGTGTTPEQTYQPGSFEPASGKSWAATAISAVSGQPSTGQDTPDGNSAFEHKYGRWVTFLWRIRPGKDWHYTVPLKFSWNSASQSSFTLLDAPDEWPTSDFQVTTEFVSGFPAPSTFHVTTRTGAVFTGVTLVSGAHVTLAAQDVQWISLVPTTPAAAGSRNTLLEVKFADEGDTEYTTLFSVDNYPIIYGSRGQYPHYFDDSIPGFSNIDFWGYRNTDLSSTAPFKVLYQKYAQLIISKDPIPVPLPSTPPAPPTGVESVPQFQNAKSYDNGSGFTTTLTSTDAGEQFNVGSGPSTGIVVRVVASTHAATIDSFVIGGVTLTPLAQASLPGWSSNERIFYGVGLSLTGLQAWTATVNAGARINVQLFAARSAVAFTAGPSVSVLSNTLSQAITQDANTLTVGMLTSNQDTGVLSPKSGTHQRWTRVGNFYRDFIVTEPPSDTSVDAVVTGGAFTYSYLGRICYLQGAVRAAPSWLPAPGQMTTLTVANGKLTNEYVDIQAPYYAAFYAARSANTYGGCFKNPYWGEYGCAMFNSGGHANTNDNTVNLAVYGASAVTFVRAVNPTPWFGTGTDADTRQNNATGSAGPQAFLDWTGAVGTSELNYGINSIDGAPGASHTYGSGDFIGPGEGGANHGTYMRVWTSAINIANTRGAVSALAVDMNSTTAGPETRSWRKESLSRVNETGHGAAPIISAWVPPQNRIYYVCNGLTAVRWFDRSLAGTLNAYVAGTGVGFDYDLADGFDGGTMFYVPSRGLLICAYRRAGFVEIQWMDVTVAQPTKGGTAILGTALPVADPWGGATWCPDNNRILIGSVTGNHDAMYEVEIPAVLSGSPTWPVTRRALGAGQSWPVMNSTGEFQRFHYDKALKAVFYLQSGFAPCTGYAYKPFGT